MCSQYGNCKSAMLLLFAFVKKNSGKKSIAMLLLWLAFLNAYTQFVKNDWGKVIQDNSGNLIKTLDITQDNQGNVIVVGTIVGEYDFDPGPGTALDTSKGFFAKYNSSGDLIWVKTLRSLSGQSLYTQVQHVVTDNIGNIYIAGTNYGDVDLDPGSGTASIFQMGGTTQYWFCAKYDVNGNLMWGTGGNKIETPLITELMINNNGDLLAWFFKDATNSTTPQYTINQFNTSSGNIVYGRSIFPVNANSTYSTGNNIFLESSIEQDKQGNYIVSGLFRGTIDVDFDNTNQYLITSNAGYYPNSFLCKYNSNWEIQWGFAIGNNIQANNRYTSVCHITTDSLGNIYIGGSIADTVDMDPSAGVTLVGVPNRYQKSYLAKYSPAGTLVWARNLNEVSPAGHELQDTWLGGLAISGDGNSVYFSAGLSSNTGGADYNGSPSGHLIFPFDVEYYQSNWIGLLGNMNLNGVTIGMNSFPAPIGVDYGNVLSVIGENVYVATSHFQINSSIYPNGFSFGACQNNPFLNTNQNYTLSTFAKYSPCNNIPVLLNDMVDTMGCRGLPFSLSANVGNANCTAYRWMKKVVGGHGWTIVSYSSTLYFPASFPNSHTISNSISDTGTYVLTVEGECGSVSSSIFHIGVRQPLNIPIKTFNRSVCEASPYTLNNTITVTQGESPVSYTWKKGNTVISNQWNYTLTSTQLSDSGRYVCYISDWCKTDSVVVNLTVNPLPSVTVTPPSLTLCQGTTGTFVSPGQQGVYYVYTNSTFAPVATGAAQYTTGTAGTYYLIATGVGSCKDTSSALTVTVNTLPVAGITSNAVNNTVCAGTDVLLTATGGISYSWNNNLPGGSQHTVSPATTTQYAVTVTDANNCTASATRQITVNALPIINFSSGSTTICRGSSATLTLSGTSVSYQWNNGLGAGITKTVSPVNTTAYTVTGTSSNNCTATQTAVVTVDTVAAAITGNTTVCPGGNTTLTATGGTGYSWSNGLGVGAVKTVSPTTATTYTVTVTGANNCTAAVTASVTIGTLPVGSVTGPTSICPGENTTLTATGGNTYTWSNGLGTGAAQTVSPSATTTYTITVTDANNCSATTAATVTVNSVNAAINGPVSICSGLSATLTASGGNTYQWSDGLGSNAQITVNPITPTTYTVTVTGAGNCSATASQTVSVQNAPVATITGATSICPGSSVTLTANGGNTYSWGSNLGSNPAITVSPTSSTTYTVTASLGANCTATATHTVNILQATTGQIAQTICNGESIIFNSQTLTQAGVYRDTLVNVAGCDSVLTLSLTVLPPVSTSYNQTICFGSSYIFNGNTLSASGQYTTSYTAANGCDSTVQLNLTVLPQIQSSINAQICNGQSFTFNGQTLTQPGIYRDTLLSVANCDSIVTLNLTSTNYITNSFSQSICAGDILNFNGNSISQSGTYTDTVSGGVNCDTIITLTLIVNALPQPTISNNNNELSTQTFNSYQWLLNGNPINNATSQTFTATVNGNYAVIVTNADNCTDTSAIITVTGVSIDKVLNSQIKVYPNPATTLLTIETGSLEKYTVYITNLNGSIVMQYPLKGITNTDISLLAEGVYILRITDHNQTYFTRFVKH